jgi:hypothetical protein
MPRSSNYRLKEDFYFGSTYGSYQDGKKLPAGTYIRPIDLSYVPNHVINDQRWRHFNSELEVFCYTRFGIIPIPKTYVVGE